MSLYNCKSVPPDSFRITKFDDDLNPVKGSSYILIPSGDDPSAYICGCPAGARPTCRHRQMLPNFIKFARVDTGWVCEFEPDIGTFGWREYVGPFASDEGEESVEGLDEPSDPNEAENILARERISGGYIPFESEKLADALEKSIALAPARIKRRV